MNRYIVVCVENTTRRTQFVWDGGKWVKTENEDVAYRFVQPSVVDEWVNDHPTVLPDGHSIEVRRL